jgi:D-amino-acid dehydrogenase
MEMNNNSDVLVIGGGIIGTACAYYLMKEGWRVRILEQSKFNEGASNGNCGLIVTSHLLPLCVPGAIRNELKRMILRRSPLYVKPSLDFNRLHWFLNFARKCNAEHLARAIRVRERILHHSEQLYNTLIHEEKIECEWKKKGILMVYKAEAEMEKYSQTNAYLKPYGLDAKPYLGDALLELEPALRKDIFGAWYHPIESHLRPEALLREWLQVLIRAGAVIQEDCRLINFVVEGDRVERIITTKGEFNADHYVLATGAWTPQIARQLNLRVPVQAGKGYSITMARPSICPEIPCYFYEKSVVATPWKSGYRLGGTMEFSGFNTTMVPERLQNLKNVAREYLQDPVGEPVLEEWVGMRPMTYDDLPIIDCAPRHRNLFMATGHGMTGISMAPSTGKLVAEIITGCTPHLDPAPFSIQRFQ